MRINLSQYTREYPSRCSTGMWCVTVCQKPRPYPYLRYPFWKHRRFNRTHVKCYCQIGTSQSMQTDSDSAQISSDSIRLCGIPHQNGAEYVGESKELGIHM